MLLEIDCKNKLSKIENLVNYDDKGNVLYEETYKNGEWTSIIPESKLEETYNKICATPERQEEPNALKDKCGKQCEAWFKSYQQRYPSDKFTYENHYNKRLNKCFVLLKYSEKQLKSLRNINDNTMYGSFLSKQDGKIIICNVLDKKCNSEEEWNSLVKPYMED